MELREDSIEFVRTWIAFGEEPAVSIAEHTVGYPAGPDHSPERTHEVRQRIEQCVELGQFDIVPDGAGLLGMLEAGPSRSHS